MESDIKLNGNQLDLEADKIVSKSKWFVAEAWDIQLDHPERRKSSEPTNRRALVHNIEDGLSINYRGDYPAGVTIDGEVKCSDILESRRIVATHRLGVSDDASLYVGGNAKFKKSPQVPDLFLTDLDTSGTNISIGGNAGIGGIGNINLPNLIGVSLVKTIKDLQNKIEELENRLKALENQR